MGGYINEEAKARRDEMLSRLGKHKMAKACLYVTRLKNIDLAVLEELIRDNMAYMEAVYPE